MTAMLDKLEKIKKLQKGYWTERIISQLEYAFKLSKVKEGKYDALIEKTVQFLWGKYKEEGTVTKDATQRAEDMILDISKEAKDFKVICAAHAHIDMDWMWSFAETVAITLDTFRTMLDLMKEYPLFKFSQSQAAVYRIVEEYDPVMLEEIKSRVREGRWEITASTWVEADKNMPNGESMARHILYTKRYLSELMGIEPDSLNIDFEPDTFGHSESVPEILSKGGVKYYYHCRGYEGENLYRWESSSGASIVVLREPNWYSSSIVPSIALCVPDFCTKHGMDTMLRVYGVGDHGGGPTRNDIEKLIEMSNWPVFPEIRFGTFGEYFDLVEKVRERLPMVKGELNFKDTGCYTSQTRIKTANRFSEARLNEAEAISSLSTLFANGTYRREVFENAWKKVLFNQFHDILPGSGTVETREHALGTFQEVLAAANTEESIAVRSITSQIDTSMFTNPDEETGCIDTVISTSEGAGVGFGLKDFHLPQTERGRGILRIFHVFNSSAYTRNEQVEIIIWDWEGDQERIVFYDSEGREVRHQIIGNYGFIPSENRYWGHKYIRLVIDAEVPSYGYNTYKMVERALDDISIEVIAEPRVDKTEEYILENEHIRVVFDTQNVSIMSLIHKSSGKEMVDCSRHPGVFRIVDEDDIKGATAWTVGRYMDVCSLNETNNVKIIETYINKNALRQWIKYRLNFRNSKLEVTVSLGCNQQILDFNVECDWHEVGKEGGSIPQLNFYLPLGYKCSSYKYDIPFGTIVRSELDMDVPANSWACGVPEEQGWNAVVLATDSKYGYRCINNAMSITLIRGSYNPDPYPEYGIHKFKFAVMISDSCINKDIIEKVYNYNHPMSFISDAVHKGVLLPRQSFISIQGGNAVISAIKMPEERDTDDSIIIRVYETEGSMSKISLSLYKPVKDAYFMDINEKRCENDNIISIDGANMTFTIKPYQVETIYVILNARKFLCKDFV